MNSFEFDFSLNYIEWRKQLMQFLHNIEGIRDAVMYIKDNNMIGDILKRKLT